MKLIDRPLDTNDPGFLYLNLRPNEEVKYIVRHHWAGFVGTMILVFVMAMLPVLALVILHYILPNRSPDTTYTVIIVVSAFLIFLLTFLFSAWINYYYDIVIITSERMINVNQVGMLARQTSELNLRQVQDASAQTHGVWQTAFNYGLLVIQTAGETSGSSTPRVGLEGFFSIPDVPDPNRLARLVLELHHEALGNG